MGRLSYAATRVLSLHIDRYAFRVMSLWPQHNSVEVLDYHYHSARSSLVTQALHWHCKRNLVLAITREVLEGCFEVGEDAIQPPYYRFFYPLLGLEGMCRCRLT